MGPPGPGYSDIDPSPTSSRQSPPSQQGRQRREEWAKLVGLWKENLFSELHWKSMQRIASSGEHFRFELQKVMKAGYIAPSWSWASTGLGVVVQSDDEHAGRAPFHFRTLGRLPRRAGQRRKLPIRRTEKKKKTASSLPEAARPNCPGCSRMNRSGMGQESPCSAQGPCGWEQHL